MVAASLLVAMSIVFGKYLAVNVGEAMRFSFENLPIILTGMMFGPIVGLVAGVVSDLIGCLLVGYAINPLVTIGAATIGFLSGLVYLLMNKTKAPYCIKIALPIFCAHLFGSVIIKTIGLSQWYQMPFEIFLLWRVLNYAIIGILEFILLYFVMKNKSVKAQLNLFTKG